MALPIRSPSTSVATAGSVRPENANHPSRHRADTVADAGGQLPPRGSIGHETAGPGGEQRSALVQAGRDAQREGGEATGHHEISGQNTDHHFGRDVRQHAGDAKAPDVRGHLPLERIAGITLERRQAHEPVSTVHAG